MSQSDQAWNDVAEQLKAVSARFKVHYHDQEADPGQSPASQEEVKDAFRTLGDSSMAALGTFGTFVKDPKTHAELRRTTELFFDALAASFSELGSDISRGSEVKYSDGDSRSDAVVQPDTTGAEDTNGHGDDVAEEPSAD